MTGKQVEKQKEKKSYEGGLLWARPQNSCRTFDIYTTKYLEEGTILNMK